MILDPQTMAEFLQLGGQYMLPTAALLRALYAGMRGKLPEGFWQIVIASLFAGVVAVVGQEQLDIRSVALGIASNTLFMAGLLSFIMIYLLRQPDRGKLIDGLVGGGIGLIVWLVWTYILNNPWPWWTIPLAVAAGAAAFIVLRMLLRQIARLVKIATYFIVIGVILVIGAGAVLLLQTVMQSAGV